MRSVSALLSLLLALIMTAATGGGARADGRLTVVELFTSQGCASCPAADAVLASLAGESTILPLSEHVVYWDYLGWSDPFALAETTARQRRYAERLGLPYVYTPQMIIQGSLHVKGSDRAEVLKAITAAPPPVPLPVAIRREGEGRLIVSLGEAALAEPVDLWLAFYDPWRSTRIAAGENSGRSLRNVNVVRALQHIGTWTGEPTELTVVRPAGRPVDGDCAVLVQEQNAGRILGAARLSPQ